MPALRPPERRSRQPKDPATSKNLIPIHRAVAASLADRQQSLQISRQNRVLEVSNCNPDTLNLAGIPRVSRFERPPIRSSSLTVEAVFRAWGKLY